MINKSSLQRLTRNSSADKTKALLQGILSSCEDRAKDGRGVCSYYLDREDNEVNNKVIAKLRSLGLQVEHSRGDEQIQITWDQAAEDRRNANRVRPTIATHPNYNAVQGIADQIMVDPVVLQAINEQTNIAVEQAIIYGTGTVYADETADVVPTNTGELNF